MRASLPLTLLIAALMTACASTKDLPASMPVGQSGPLKVHPGLMGEPAPTAPATQPRPPTIAPTPEPAAKVSPEPGIKMDQTGLRTQRSVYFDLNSTALRDEFVPALKSHANYLAANPKSRIRIEGNADERGAAGYNNALGMKRADNVRQAIITHGAPAKQVRVKTLGESRPKLKGHDEESWAENRRADVVYEKEN